MKNESKNKLAEKKTERGKFLDELVALSQELGFYDNDRLEKENSLIKKKEET